MSAAVLSHMLMCSPAALAAWECCSSAVVQHSTAAPAWWWLSARPPSRSVQQGCSASARMPASPAHLSLRCRHPSIHPRMPVFPLCPSGATPPKYLDGTMLGDYGFDPLRLGSKDKASSCWVLPPQRGVVW